MSLAGKIAVVTGASRGVGRGIALELGAAGATVYVTGRTRAAGQASLPGSLAETVQAIETAGGRGIAWPCDHRDDAQVAALFAQVQQAHGGLDVLVNNVFAVPAGPLSGVPFWKQPIALWDEMHTVGLRSHYVASVQAAPLLIERARQSAARGVPGSLIVNVSSFAGAGFALNVAYGVGKAGVDRLAADMAHDLRPYQVAAVSLWPGIVRTERLLAGGGLGFNLGRAESAEYSGRAVVALAGDPRVMERSGKAWPVYQLAEAYGFTDLDGTRPDAFRPRRP